MDTRGPSREPSNPQAVDWESIFGSSNTQPVEPQVTLHDETVSQQVPAAPLPSRNPFRQHLAPLPQPIYQSAPPSINNQTSVSDLDLEAEELELRLRLISIRKRRLLQDDSNQTLQSPSINSVPSFQNLGSQSTTTFPASPLPKSSFHQPSSAQGHVYAQAEPYNTSTEWSRFDIESSRSNRDTPIQHVSRTPSVPVDPVVPSSPGSPNLEHGFAASSPKANAPLPGERDRDVTDVKPETFVSSLPKNNGETLRGSAVISIEDRPSLQKQPARSDLAVEAQRSLFPNLGMVDETSNQDATHAGPSTSTKSDGSYIPATFVYESTNSSLDDVVMQGSSTRTEIYMHGANADLPSDSRLHLKNHDHYDSSAHLGRPETPKALWRTVSSSSIPSDTEEQSTQPTTPSGWSTNTSTSGDHQMALILAAEEAQACVAEGRPADLHPLLQQQLAESMKHYIPDDVTSSQGSASEANDPLCDSALNTPPILDTLEAENQLVLDEKPLPRPSRQSLEVSGQPKGKSKNPLAAAFSHSSKIFGKGDKPTKDVDVTKSQTEQHENESEEEEDLCYCGEAQVKKDTCYYCWPCGGTVYCDLCWSIPPPHNEKYKRSKFSRAGGRNVVHEKSDPARSRKIVEALHSDHTLEQQALMHSIDEDTAWFGTGRDPETGDTVFQDFGRYSRLLAEMPNSDQVVRYPALVSFVGQTGAGKSSLIRLLIELHTSNESSPQVPVVGSTRRSDLPTSGDVHLYADLKTLDSEHPMLLADCEGLDGGEREPVGARLKNKTKSVAGPRQRTNSFSRNIRRQHHTSERELLWATDTLRKSREYHVRHLYPRLLYTFSDVIVFVMKNPRVVESVIEQLLRWAADALETSSNQPVLPHAIIVLNAYENTSDVDLWDPNQSTINLMEQVSRAVHLNHNIRKFAEFWRQKGRQIETVEMLLLSYYSSIRVVRVPDRGRPKLMDEQLQKLYSEISEACQKSRTSKHQLRMLLNANDLQPYIQYAFDHFSRNLEKPFDFVQASLWHSPIASDLAGNILKLAIDINTVWKDKLDAVFIFRELSFMIASCIMVECARRRTLGPAEKMVGAYIHHWDTALRDFCDRHWPCEYVHPNTQGRCVNVKAGHMKGHQLQNGKVLSVGEYQSEFSFERNMEPFRYCVLQVLADLTRALSCATVDSPQLELEKALDIHRKSILSRFFRHLGGAQKYISHTVCYSCLLGPPEHALPCGHVLCTPCIKGYGAQRGRTLWEISSCPQHYDQEDGRFPAAWPIHIKPVGAGVRVLTLDGGGVRGIVELSILKEVEQKLGQGLPIQSFFDLIVGTSTGGIVALGLGANGWTIHKCIRFFERLCKQAFTKRRGIGIPGIEHFVTVANDSRYETEPIERALKTAFGEEQNLFAGSKDDLLDQAALQRLTKTAVVVTTLGGTPTVLGNYNRTEDGEVSNYHFHRSDKSEGEMKTWEAARSTSAAPLFFKPYTHDPSGQVYQDGCLYYNNPIRIAMREARLLWPDRAEFCPDVILSVGSGFNEHVKIRKPVPKRSRFALVRTIQNLANMANDHIHSSLNSEQTWRDFLSETNPPPHLKERFTRLNLRMDEAPPRMDDVQKVQALKEMTLSRFTKDSRLVRDVADRLLATSFFFGLIPEETAEVEGKVCVYGLIQCRFPSGHLIRALGEAIRSRSRGAYNKGYSPRQPFFVIQERRREAQAEQVMFTQATIDRMVEDGIFTMNKIAIHITDNNAETEVLLCYADHDKKDFYYPISGFPRRLGEEVDRVLRPKLIQADSRHFVTVPRDLLEAKKASWRFDFATFMKDPLSTFDSADYRNPGNAGDTMIEELSGKYSDDKIFVSQTSDGLGGAIGDSAVEFSLTAKDLEGPLTDEEMMRQQFLRLLLSEGLRRHFRGKIAPVSPQFYQRHPALLPKVAMHLLPTVPNVISPGVCFELDGTALSRRAVAERVGKAPKLPRLPFI